MQISTIYFPAASVAVLPGALAGKCKPKHSSAYTSPVYTPPVYSSFTPVQTPPAYTCVGNLKCCTMPLQGGNVAAYCAQSNAPAAGCSTGMYTLCCDYNAEEALTPRGYTYVGCSDPTVSSEY